MWVCSWNCVYICVYDAYIHSAETMILGFDLGWFSGIDIGGFYDIQVLCLMEPIKLLGEKSSFPIDDTYAFWVLCSVYFESIARLHIYVEINLAVWKMGYLVLNVAWCGAFDC